MDGCLGGAFRLLARALLLDQFSEVKFCCGAALVYTLVAAFPNHGKNSFDGPTTRRVLIDFQLLSQLVEVFGARVHGNRPSGTRFRGKTGGKADKKIPFCSWGRSASDHSGEMRVWAGVKKGRDGLAR